MSEIVERVARAELEEGIMADSIELIIAFAQRENGHVVAASTTSPYFCFEAPDEETAKRKVEAAIAFYAETKSKRD